MYNQNKKSVLTDFTEELSAAHHLDSSSFADLYYWHYFDKSAALKREIMENLNSLSPARFNAYIKYVNNEIHEVYGYYNPDECIIGKWIEKFDLIEEDFPFDDNEMVKQLLIVNKENYESESEKKEINIRLMQLEFHWYAGHLEYLKMKRFIDELFEPKIIKQQLAVPGEEMVKVKAETKVDLEKTENPFPHIFKNLEAYILFKKLHETYGTSKIDIANYSFIYRMMYDDGYIINSFRPEMFINWVSREPYCIQLSKIKTMDNCITDSKIQTYNMIKKMLQIK